MSNKFKVFVDGQVGTTGIEIHQRLSKRNDIELLEIDYDKRKDPAEKAKLLNCADVVFLCLPDVAAKESVSLITNEKVKVIDASTAHRTNDDWAYGIPELSIKQREKIANSTRVANPGCHATGFNVLVAPLVESELLSEDVLLTSHSMTGYSGGGRQLIEEYQANQENEIYLGSRHYGLALKHKHIPEMKKVCGLKNTPIFNPILVNSYKGMLVSVPIFVSQFSKKVNAKEIHTFFENHYKNCNFVKVMPFLEDGSKMLDIVTCNGTNNLEIYVHGNDEQVFLSAKLDNLGKGASGAAVQNMNIMLGLDETIGL